ARIKAMQDELEWVRSNPKGRQAKSKARLQRFEELASTEAQARNETNEIYIPPGPRLGDLVVEASGLCKRFGDKILYDDLNFALPPGGIVGVIGPNGAGKTTLFRMITGEEKPDQGQLRIGDTVRVAAVDQSRDQLNGQKTVWEEISDGLDNITVGTYVTSSRGYCARFNFKGADQQKRIGDLSGGERNRVHLAKTLRLVLALLLFYMLLGCFLDGISMVVLTMGVIMPTVQAAGIDPIWFGIFIVFVVEMAQITPPVGFNLFVLQGMTGRQLTYVARVTMPFFGLMIVALLILYFIPGIATWLPSQMKL
ncbi:MAG: TRAP transporter large permease subunit, partial [Betaproteobacteria bacterium]|nr:TRAP transporter large permease subunit [Betaproteobacteria bacterium]